MEYFEIQGGKRLSGTITVGGMKNAATPILAATLLSSEPSIIANVPRIEDVFRMLEIIESLGAKVEWLGERVVKIDPRAISAKGMDETAVKRMRSSILLFGALSARLEKFSVPYPGGCTIGSRPLDTHFDALKKLGVRVTPTDHHFIVDSHLRHAAKVVLKEFSVTGTENAMMLAAGIPGETTIKIAAAEPHVADLGKFLISMGAQISGLGTHTIIIRGKKRLKGATHEIIPDANEAATLLIMGVATRSKIVVENAIEEHLDLVLEKLREFGADFEIGKKSIKVLPPKSLQAVGKVDTRNYPGIPTDVQAPFGVLATQAKGKTLIHDSLFEGRFNYIQELQKMGAKAKILNLHQASIEGPTKLKGRLIKSYDLRAGASLIIAALLAEGKTVIQDAYQVDRGYEKIEERLTKLGAKIQRISD